jgi:hypothetical protein
MTRISGLMIDELVLVPLDHEPGATRHGQRRKIEALHRRRDGDQQFDVARRRQPEGDETPERESERPLPRCAQLLPAPV